jgi:pyruvate,orthophosphate dikinase
VEHAFLGERQKLLYRALVSVPGPDRLESVQLIAGILRDDLVELLRIMDGRPVTVRLLDPPRHEFLPDLVDALLRCREDNGQDLAERDQFELARRLVERNPMLGMRGMRLAVAIPELAQAQMRAIIEAAVILRRRGHDPRPQLLLPMVMCVEEVEWARMLLDEVLAQPPGPLLKEPLPLGVMIETPRAAAIVASLATQADFLSVGTNDLTALLWGLSRDDADREVLPTYRQQNLLACSPFQSLDTAGAGKVIHDLLATARAANPGVQVGVCGEHVTDPAAAEFLLDAGVNYLSCPPPWVLPTRIAAAKVARAGR